MDRRQFLNLAGLAVTAMTLAGPVWAADPVQAVADRLKAEGYGDVTAHRTWLGRIQIEARRGSEEREVVIDPRSGEVLRDLTRRTGGDSESAGRSETGKSDSGQSGSDSGTEGRGSDDGGSESENDSGDDGGNDNGGSDKDGSGNDGSEGGGSDDHGSEKD